MRIRETVVVVTIAAASLGSWCNDTPPTVSPEACVARGDAAAQQACTPDSDHADPETNDGLALASVPRPGANCADERLGTLAGDGDIDVYRTASCGSSIGPQTFTGSATLKQGDSNVRTCIFFACDYGRTDVFACFLQQEDDSGASPNDQMKSADSQKGLRQKTGVSVGITDDWGDGFKGCCRTGSGTVRGMATCGGIRKQTVTMFVWIDSGSASDEASCRQYDVSYEVTSQLDL